MITDGYAPEEDGTPTKEQYYCSECGKVLEQHFTYTMKLKSGKVRKFDMCTECFVASIENDIDHKEVSQELCEQWNEIMKVIAAEDRELSKSEYETIFNIVNYGK